MVAAAQRRHQRQLTVRLYSWISVKVMKKERQKDNNDKVINIQATKRLHLAFQSAVCRRPVTESPLSRTNEFHF